MNNKLFLRIISFVIYVSIVFNVFSLLSNNMVYADTFDNCYVFVDHSNEDTAVEMQLGIEYSDAIAAFNSYEDNRNYDIDCWKIYLPIGFYSIKVNCGSRLIKCENVFDSFNFGYYENCVTNDTYYFEVKNSGYYVFTMYDYYYYENGLDFDESTYSVCITDVTNTDSTNDSDGVIINAKNFPDDNFRDYVKEFDKDSNGYLANYELSECKWIDLRGISIHSLEGIKFFTNLEELYVENANLNSIDLSGLSNLHYLDVKGNNLEELDISNCPILLELYYDGKLEIKKFDYINHVSFYIFYSLSNPVYRLVIDADTNIITDEIPVDAVVKIDSEHFPDDDFRTYLFMNYDTTRDGYLTVSEIDEAKYLDMSSDSDIPFNMGYIRESLSLKGIEYLTNLNYINCTSNKITYIDLSNCTELQYLNLDNCDLNELDISNCTKLKELSIGQNNIAEIDLSNNNELLLLHCRITSLVNVEVPDSVKFLLVTNFNSSTQVNIKNDSYLHNAYINDTIDNDGMSDMYLIDNPWYTPVLNLRGWGNEIIDYDLLINDLVDINIVERKNPSEFEGTLVNGGIILNFSDTDNNGTYDKLVISGNGSMLQFYDGKNDYTSYIEDIETLIVEDGVTYIPTDVFKNHEKLRYVEYGASMNNVYYNQFEGCTNLAEVHLEAVTNIYSNAFKDCTSLKSIVIPEGGFAIYGNAFKGCTSLETVQLPSTLVAILSGAFGDCTNLTTINLGDTQLKEIESLAFENCISLKNITIPSTLLTTSTNKFYGCDLESINMSCSTHKPSIDVLVREWGDKVIINHGDVVPMEDVEATCSSFGSTGGTKCSGCGLIYEKPTQTDKLVHNPVTVPAEEPTCTRDGHTEYVKCDVCNAYITMPSRIAAHHVYDNSDDEDCNVCGAVRVFDYVYDDNITYRYIDHNGDNLFDGIIINGVDELTYEMASDIIWGAQFTVEYLEVYGFTSIGDEAFISCDFVDVKIGDSVENLGMGAFASNLSLKHIELPEHMTNIWDFAFFECESLESIVLPEGIDVIHEGTFEGCISLQYVVIPEGVYEICPEAFMGCDLRTLDLPSTMLYLDDACFDGNDNLSNITMYCNDEFLTFAMVDFYGDIVTVKHTVVIDPAVEATAEHVGLTEGSHCSVCGEVIVAQEEVQWVRPNEFSLVGHSLTLDGSININFFFNISDELLSDETAYVRFTMANGETTDVAITNGIFKPEYSSYMFTCKITPKQMSEVVSVNVVTREWTSDTYTYSVVEYAEELYALAETNSEYAEAKGLVEAMLTYGAYSQEYFGYNTENVAVAPENRVAIDSVSTDTLLFYSQYSSVQGNQVTLVGANMTLLSETTLRLYFAVPQNVKVSDVVITMNGELQMLKNSGEYYYIEIENISSDKLDDVFSFEIWIAGELDSVVSYSPMTYCYNTLNSETNDTITEELKNVVRALYIYNYYSNIYFG